MHLYNHLTGKNWQISEEEEDGEIKELSKAKIDRTLLELIGCENLLVLSGLGSSLHLKDQAEINLAPTMWDLWCAAKETATEKIFNKILDAVNYHPETKKESIEVLLSNCKMAVDFLDDEKIQKEVSKFVIETEKIIHQKCDFLDEKTELNLHSDFLRRVARRSNRKVRTKIFTTNYDKCFEQAGNNNGYVVIDGFSHSLPQTFDSGYFQYDIVRRDSSSDSSDYVENVFHLYKLHGSVDWDRTDTGVVVKKTKPENPIIVYPRHNKYELAFEPPYLEMMGAFQTALRKPNTGLLVVGFGFNDNHLSEPIISAIKSNLNCKIVVCDPSLMPGTEDAPLGKDIAKTNPYLQKLKKLIDLGDPRISFLNATFEELVPFIPDMVAQDEREKHLERLSKIQDQST